MQPRYGRRTRLLNAIVAMKKSISLDPGRIRHWREQRGLTQQALGDAVLASAKPASRLRRIQAWERNGRVWDRLVDALTRALDVGIDDLKASNADIAGLWLCWSGPARPPAAAVLRSSLHQAFDEVHQRIEHACDPRERLRAALFHTGTVFRIELTAPDTTDGPAPTPMFVQAVRWHTRHGLLWRRPTALERNNLQRLFDSRVERS